MFIQFKSKECCLILDSGCVSDVQHLKYLDGWRGLAIVFLLLGHFFPVPGIDLGIFGVNLFFVLSGYLMAGLLFVKETPISIFYKRRISRIFPVFFLFLILSTLVWGWVGRNIIWPEFIVSALFLNNYFVNIGHEKMPYGHIWSLCVEEHSYVLLSLVAFAIRRWNFNPVALVGFICIISAGIGIWYWYEPTSGKWIYSEVSAYGILISAVFLLFFKKFNIKQLPILFYVLLAMFGFILHWWSVPKPIQTIGGVTVLALMVNLLANAPDRIHAILSLKPLRYMGIWSFSIYIWQQPLYILVQRDKVIPQLTGVILSIFLGVASYYFIEMPARRYLNRTWAKDRVPVQNSILSVSTNQVGVGD